MNASRHRLNLWARILEGADDTADEVLDERDVVRLTGGVFPTVFFNATYDADRVQAEEWEALERRFDLRLLRQGRSRHNTPF